jgi:ABC-type cobalamin/Fe3+-siderophores transport system ATPase subunit
VVALDRGRVSRNGPPGEVLDPGFIRSLFHVKVARVGARGLVVLPEL